MSRFALSKQEHFTLASHGVQHIYVYSAENYVKDAFCVHFTGVEALRSSRFDALIKNA